MTDELKPCPFCGGRASFSTTTAAGYAFYVAECLDCKALLSKLSKGELLTAWNRRDYSHIEVTDAMVEAAVAAYHADDPSVLQEEGNHWLVDGMRLARTGALNVKEG